MKPNYQTKLTLNILTIGLALMIILIALISRAQTNVDENSFLTTAKDWITQVDTNFPFTGTTLEFSTGYKQQVGINAANYVNVQYDLGKFNVGGDIQFSGFGSAVNQIEFQFGYALIEHYSVKLDADLRFGYSTVSDSGVIEPALVLKKKLSTNTYAEMGVSMPEFLNQKSFNTSPSFILGAGFTY